MNNLIVRALAGSVYVALIIGSLILGNVSFGLLCLIILLISMDEFYRLSKRLKIKTLTVESMVFSGLWFLILILLKNDLVKYGWIFLAPLFIIIMLIRQLMLDQRNPIANIAVTFFPLFYIVVPIATLYLLGFYSRYSWGSEFQADILIGFFILNWSSDTGAYLAGNAFGKNKLFERVSPKKTIEGSLGGLIFTLGISYVLSMYYVQISVLDWLIIALLIVVFGTTGDLFESLLKRKAEVKDSGNFIPGHGGMLDRFDSVLFSAPIVFVYLHLVAH